MQFAYTYPPTKPIQSPELISPQYSPDRASEMSVLLVPHARRRINLTRTTVHIY
jgi:hypothetical protein